MTRLRAALIFLAVWACVYLPGLGSTELKGEEGRRILPAVTMLDTGNWLVPFVGGKPFLRKPPLVNWAIAASFALTGVRNEWTARLPSALCVLSLGLVLVALGRGPDWMDAETALVAAIMASTSLGLLAKARFAGAEIEGIYVPLAGIAMATWMAWWTQRRSPWLTWTVPWVFLGLACLAKGPTLHLVFFYALVLAVVWKAEAWREFIHPAHLAGIALCVAIFAAWFIPFRHTPEAAETMKVWKRQGIDRFLGSEFVAGNYFTNIPRGLMDQLPWLLFAPLVIAAQRGRDGCPSRPRNAATGDDADPVNDTPRTAGDSGPCRLAALREGALLAAVFCFVAILLIPGVLPRYVLPLTLPWSILVAFALQGAGTPGPNARRDVPLTEMRAALLSWHAFHRIAAGVLLIAAIMSPLLTGTVLSGTGPSFIGNLRFLHPQTAAPALLATLAACAICGFVLARRPGVLHPTALAVTTSSLLACGSFIYGGAIVHSVTRHDDLRPVAAQIDATIPPGKSLIIFDPGYRAEIFYLRTPYRYATEYDEIPADAEFVLALAESRRRLEKRRPDLVVTHTFPARQSEELLLLQPGAAVSEDAPPVTPKSGSPH